MRSPVCTIHGNRNTDIIKVMKNKDIKNGDFVLYTRGDEHVILYVEFYNESDDVWLGTDSDGEDYFFEASDVDVVDHSEL